MGLLGNYTFNNLNDLFVQQLKDLYDAEHRLTEALPLMRDAATSSQLKAAFDMHSQQTQQHAARLEKVFRRINCEPERETCHGIKGLISEGQDIIDAKGDCAVKDAGLIAAAQRVEHYEIAAYGTVRSFAEQLGLSDIVPILQQTLDEEGDTDKKLTQIAENQANVSAPQGMPQGAGEQQWNTGTQWNA
jgi:ferritin-like metal-binding protein YciE